MTNYSLSGSSPFGPGSTMPVGEREKTLIELERGTIVQENRSAFQHAMQDRFISDVQRLSGRHVLAFISNQHVGPDMEIELFVLGPAHSA